MALDRNDAKTFCLTLCKSRDKNDQENISDVRMEENKLGLSLNDHMKVSWYIRGYFNTLAGMCLNLELKPTSRKVTNGG